MKLADDLPLFTWTPPTQIIVFPMTKRIGKIRDVASKLLTKSTLRHADSYKDQVSQALLNQMMRVGIPENQQDEQLGAFWHAVDAEVLRLTYAGRNSGGAA